MFSTSSASVSMGSFVNQPMMVSTVALSPAIAETSVYRTTCPAKAVMKSTNSLMLVDRLGRSPLRLSRAGARLSLSSSATATRLSQNATNATASSTSRAVPRPIANGSRPALATVATPRAAVTTPIPTSRAVPRPIPVAMVSPLSRTGCHACSISSNPLPIAQISTRNSPVATPNSARIAVPRAMFTMRVVPAEPSRAVATPTATNAAVPIPTAIATVPALAITGCQESPTCAKPSPSRIIEPTIRPAATATSPIITIPKPRFFAREVRFGDSFVLTVVSRVSTAVATLVVASVAVLIVATSLSLENASSATARPPIISIALIISVTLSTPSHLPVRIASMMLSISPKTPLIPCATRLQPTIFRPPVFIVSKPIPIPILLMPLIAVLTLSQFTSLLAISAHALTISPTPCTIFRTPPSLTLPRIINASPIAPSPSAMRPATFFTDAPFSKMSCKYSVNFFKSAINIMKPTKPVGVEKPFMLDSVLRKLVILFAIFHAASPAPIAVTVNRILPRRESNRSDHELIPSVIPSHSFIF